jgi:hypothetical protein
MFWGVNSDGSYSMWTLIVTTLVFSGSVTGGVAANTVFLDFPDEVKCQKAATATGSSERIDLGAVRPGYVAPQGNYRIVARCVER